MLTYNRILAKTSLFALVICFLFINFKTSVSAQDAGFLISPPTFELSASPGDTLTNTVRVENVSNQPIEINIDKRRFVAKGEEGSVELIADNMDRTLAGWMQVSPTSAVIQPKSSQTFTIFTQIPGNAEPGGHFASIVFSSGKADASAEGASIVQEVGVLSLLKVAGIVEEKWHVASFSSPKKLYEKGLVPLETRVENTGTIHVKLTGSITITDLLGRVVDKIEVEPKNVLPGAIRRYDVEWSTNQWFGRYQATVFMTSGPESQIDTATTTFIIFPYKLAGIVTIITIILILILIRLRGRIAKSFRVLVRG